MSDDFKDVSVVEAVESAPSAEPVEPPTEELSAETSPEPVHDDERVFTPSTRIGNAEDYNRQQIAEENGMALGNGGVDGRTVTQTGHAAKAEAEKDKKSDLIEHLEQSERRKDWLERDHDFGGMRMSGHDLAKMIDFISDPDKQKELRARLTGKYPKDKEKIDKGMKELNEYIDLKKKEQDGGKLSEEQYLRLKEIEKSEEFKVVAKEAERFARADGVKFSKEHMQEMATARMSSNEAVLSGAAADVKNMQAATKKIDCDDFEDTSVPCLEAETPPVPIAQVVSKASYVAASARDDLPKTVALTETFTDTNASQITAARNKSPLALGATDPLVSAEAAAIANTNNVTYTQKPPVTAASASF